MFIGVPESGLAHVKVGGSTSIHSPHVATRIPCTSIPSTLQYNYNYNMSILKMYIQHTFNIGTYM